jgi:hypothetical protein
MVRAAMGLGTPARIASNRILSCCVLSPLVRVETTRVAFEPTENLEKLPYPAGNVKGVASSGIVDLRARLRARGNCAGGASTS